MVSILMGSRSDWEVMSNAGKILKEFGIEHDVRILSAHRTPKHLMKYLDEAQENGIKVFIAGAGFAAHLAGVIASHTTLPVLGVPLDSSSLKGIDSLLSTVQMPSGMPVATFTIGQAGAVNAALFSVQILAANNEKLAKKLTEYRQKMADKIINEKP